MKYSLQFLLDMQKSIEQTGMYMPNHYWAVYKELKEKYPDIDTGFADRNMVLFLNREYPNYMKKAV